MLNGFKKFISRGNMIDMAVGVVMGAAVTSVVNSIVDSLINPLIAMIFGKPNMKNLLTVTFNNSTVSFGAVLGALINFLLIAVAVYFCILVPINKFRDVSEALFNKKDEQEQAEADKGEQQEARADERTVELLGRIADSLDELKGNGTSVPASTSAPADQR
ncbi:large conductance mechanosensitive channel protein MscL [Bifidobacterium sp. ESL0763]|uniref:large conductance mechanosensitive channel protein MscL n=1 Tax=Bifidobacterium sp. ESL0763 TaxID=2983227 RepID=UPI0023F7EC00|nr:large conductance mechanosensitive channel protein MscL [Bifidobacterium sp. ESL0763]MDF7663127.1 large conductance mechanosensitive channel protein MscL [Bifidobacterium sp. ESL0763]